MLGLKKLVMTIVGAAVVTLGISGTAQASLDFLSTSGGEVGTIDTSTGNFLPLFQGEPSFLDIALSTNNNLFGVTYNQLYKINQSTNSVSLIGNFFPFINALGFSNNDVLYGAGGSGFYTINTSTGAVSLVANIPGFNSSGDVVFDSIDNRFWATSSGLTNDILFSIALDGTATQIGSIGFNNVQGLSFDNGTLLGYTASNQQIVIDPATGTGTFNKNVTGTAGSIYGAASSPSTAPEPVSEPTTTLDVSSPSTAPKSVPEPTTTLDVSSPSTAPKSVPEPTATLDVLAFGALGVGSLLKCKIKRKD